MATFTFIEIEQRDSGYTRTVTVLGMEEGRDCRSTRHLDRWMKAGDYAIIAMYQVDRPTLREAQEWLLFCVGGAPLGPLASREA